MATKSKKSSPNVNSRKSKENVLSKHERTSVISRGKKSLSLVNEDDFAYQFRKYCLENNTKIIPNVRTVLQEPIAGDFSTVISTMELTNSIIMNQKQDEDNKLFPEVLVTYIENIYLNTVIFKHFIVNRNMLIALKKALKMYNTISVLKLEFCHLTDKEIRMLQTILHYYDSIEEVSINGNPNKYQNYYLLLKETKLKYLSLRFCKINEKGIKKITQVINNTECEMVYLNLSSNFISDEGVIHIANALRCNRSLLSLNLADNWITDTGCIILMSVMQKFSLNHDEIVIRRHRNMAHLLKKKELLQLQIKSSTLIINSTSQNLTIKNSSHSEKRSHKNTKSTSSMSSMKKHEQELSEIQLPFDTHPFIKDSFEENNEIYCKGNMKLNRLNLAYNKITGVGLRAIIQCLEYQRYNILSIDEGLVQIVLEGNVLSNCSFEMNEIQELLSHSYEKKKSSDSNRSSRKRPSSRLSVRLSLP